MGKSFSFFLLNDSIYSSGHISPTYIKRKLYIPVPRTVPAKWSEVEVDLFHNPPPSPIAPRSPIFDQEHEATSVPVPRSSQNYSPSDLFPSPKARVPFEVGFNQAVNTAHLPQTDFSQPPPPMMVQQSFSDRFNPMQASGGEFQNYSAPLGGEFSYYPAPPGGEFPDYHVATHPGGEFSNYHHPSNSVDFAEFHPTDAGYEHYPTAGADYMYYQPQQVNKSS